MPFDEPRDHGGGGGEDWFFIAKTLQEDVPRGCPVSVIYDGRLAAFTARETLIATGRSTRVSGSPTKVRAS